MVVVEGCLCFLTSTMALKMERISSSLGGTEEEEEEEEGATKRIGLDAVLCTLAEGRGVLAFLLAAFAATLRFPAIACYKRIEQNNKGRERERGRR